MENFSEHFGRLKNSYRAAYLISGFLQKNLSIEEEEELDKWILESEENMQLFEDLTDEKTIDGFLKWYAGRDVEKNLREVKQRLRFRKSSTVVSFWKYAAAACIFAIFGVSVYYFLFDKNERPHTNLTVHKIDIAPGSEYALLKLSNGKMITLNQKEDTVINEQVKVVNGELVYSDKVQNEQEGMNELIVPRKSFYKINLPDGSKVWLNSESSIRYPNEFVADQRHVSVTGETYFEVAHDASKPFIVSVSGIDVQALGTEFNINAYTNEEDVQTTLIHGMIRVSSQGKEEILKPGQQVRIKDNDWKMVNDVETDPVTAWKDNKFKFKKASIEQIMRQVERWYDVKVNYSDKISYHFNGTIDRSVPVSHLLQILEETGNVNFEIKEKEIIVRK